MLISAGAIWPPREYREYAVALNRELRISQHTFRFCVYLLCKWHRTILNVVKLGSCRNETEPESRELGIRCRVVSKLLSIHDSASSESRVISIKTL